jgi:hypothetical protein
MITLRDIETDADREAALAIRRAPGQEQLVAVPTGRIVEDEVVLRLDLRGS